MVGVRQKIRHNLKTFLENFFLTYFKNGFKSFLHRQMTEKIAFDVGPKNGKNIFKIHFWTTSKTLDEI